MSKNSKSLPTSFLDGAHTKNVDEIPRPTSAQLDRISKRYDPAPIPTPIDQAAFRAYAAPALAGVISRLGFSVNEEAIHSHVDIAFRYATLCVQLEKGYLQ